MCFIRWTIHSNHTVSPKSPRVRVLIIWEISSPSPRFLGFCNQSINRFHVMLSLKLIIPFLLFVICLIGLQAAGDLGDDLPEISGNDVCAGFTGRTGCPINCFRADPVCGADGVTYWCGCPDAACHGARVVKTGACDAGNAGSSSVPGQALLLIHIVWMLLLGLSLLVGVF